MSTKSYLLGEKLLILIGMIILSGILGAFLGEGILHLAFIDDPTAKFDFLNHPHAYPEKRTYLLLIQGIASLSLFVVSSWLYYKIIGSKKEISFIDSTALEKNNFKFLFYSPKNQSSILYLITFLLAIAVLPFVGFIYQWNMNISLPEFLSSFEHLAKSAEQDAKVMTDYLVTLTGFSEITLGFLVIAVFAGLGEEITFRGTLLPIFEKIFRNHHASIWLVGFIFSVIHLQFYGLVPRMLLGVLFGYLYYWSKNLWLPIFAHFLNNAIMLLIELYNKNQSAESTLDENTSMPLGLVFISMIISALLLYAFKKTITSKKKSGWQCVFESPTLVKGQMIHDLLQHEGLHPVLMNKKDTAYGLGNIRILVKPEEVIASKKIIDERENKEME